MKHFEENYERFVQTEDLSGLKPDYEKMLANLNQPVRVLDQNDPYEGIARGINAGGELLVERADGTVEEVNSGEDFPLMFYCSSGKNKNLPALAVGSVKL